MEQNRFHSPVVWSAVAAQLLALLVTLGVIDTGLSRSIEGIVTAALELLVTFGVLNNPTSRSGF